MTKHSKYFLFLFSGFSLLTMLLYRHHLTAPDTFNYLFISEELLSGNFYEALSGHWSMLIPVFLTPFLATSLNGIIAFKLLNWLISLFTYWLFLKMLIRIKVDERLFFWGAILAIPVIINMSMMLTPDLAMITLGLWYFLIISHPDFFNDLKYTRLAGLAGGLMFLSKSYGLPFFMAHFVSCHLIVYFFRKRFNIPVTGKIIKSLAYGLGVFLIIATPMILVLSLKFGEFTIGTAGKYNLAMTGPERAGLQITKNELIDPDTKFTKLWAYEEPAVFVDSWKPFSTKADFEYYTKRLNVNAWSIYYIPMIRDLGIILAILLSGIMILKITVASEERYLLISGILAVLIFTLGYWLLIVRPRYLWFDFLLLMLLVWQGFKIIRPALNPMIFSFWMVCTSILILINSADEFSNRLKHNSFFRKLQEVEKTIPEELLQGKNVAIIDIPKEQHLMEADAYLLYKERFRFLGQPFAETLLEEGLQPLRDFPVDYFLLWKHDDLAESVFRYEKIVFEDEEVELRIYKLTD